jgi:hypothetical protein
MLINTLTGWGSAGLPMECKAGTVVIIAYDIWHKGRSARHLILSNLRSHSSSVIVATPNISEDKLRYMFKFQFVRMEEPQRPSWNCKSTKWDPPLSGPDDVQYPLLSPAWKSMWHWLCGNKDTGSCCVASARAVFCCVVLCCVVSAVLCCVCESCVLLCCVCESCDIIICSDRQEEDIFKGISGLETRVV